MQQEVDNISDGLPPFDKDKWVSKGQKFPKNTMDIPLGLAYYINNLLIIPVKVKGGYVPSPNLSIKAGITQNGFKISTDDWKLFKEIKDNSKTVLQALKDFKQKATAEDDE